MSNGSIGPVRRIEVSYRTSSSKTDGKVAENIYNTAKDKNSGGINKAVQMLYALHKDSIDAGENIIDQMKKAIKDVDQDILMKLRKGLKLVKAKGFPADKRTSEMVSRGLEYLKRRGDSDYNIHLCVQIREDCPPVGEVVKDPAMIIVYEPKSGEKDKRILYQLGGSDPVDIYDGEKDLPVYLKRLSDYLGKQNFKIRPQNYYEVDPVGMRIK
ncbi:MAG: hypothetical protein ABIH00_04090 [Armatimonadota bacterium]